MTNQPFISIIVPVYNGEKTISACLDSLLSQEYPAERYEVVVVGNGSSDRTREIIDGLQASGST